MFARPLACTLPLCVLCIFFFVLLSSLHLRVHTLCECANHFQFYGLVGFSSSPFFIFGNFGRLFTLFFDLLFVPPKYFNAWFLALFLSITLCYFILFFDWITLYCRLLVAVVLFFHFFRTVLLGPHFYQCFAKYVVVAFYCCYLKFLIRFLSEIGFRWRHISFYMHLFLFLSPFDNDDDDDFFRLFFCYLCLCCVCRLSEQTFVISVFGMQ